MEDEMKKQIELFTNSNSLPKIDLRVSLPGSIRKTTLLELASSVEKKDIESCFSKITREAPYLFNEVNSKLFKSIDIVKRVTKEILEDWKKHNVIYMEIVTNLYSLEGKFNKEEFLLAVLEQINEENKLSEKFNGRLIISLKKKDKLIICVN